MRVLGEDKKERKAEKEPVLMENIENHNITSKKQQKKPGIFSKVKESIKSVLSKIMRR